MMYPSFPWAWFGQLLAAIALLWLLINTLAALVRRPLCPYLGWVFRSIRPVISFDSGRLFR
jgi:hypothetical protein